MTPRERIDKARKTNNRRDEAERGVGWTPPGDCAPDFLLRTIMSAIDAGLQSEDWDCVAEAYEMAIDLHLKMKGMRYDPARIWDNVNPLECQASSYRGDGECWWSECPAKDGECPLHYEGPSDDM